MSSAGRSRRRSLLDRMEEIAEAESQQQHEDQEHNQQLLSSEGELQLSSVFLESLEDGDAYMDEYEEEESPDFEISVDVIMEDDEEEDLEEHGTLIPNSLPELLLHEDRKQTSIERDSGAVSPIENLGYEDQGETYNSSSVLQGHQFVRGSFRRNSTTDSSGGMTPTRTRRSVQSRLASRSSIETTSSVDTESSSRSSSMSILANWRNKGVLNRRSRNGHLRSSTNHSLDSMAEAVSRLQLSNNDMDHVSAAASIVATQSSGQKRGNVQFTQGDYALVMLTILRLADHDAEHDLYTVAPVNSLGFPQGEGKTEEQRQGPFIYVLCMVTQVHFDEDERYYTVRRCDNGKEQRADPGFMQPIRGMDRIEIAMKAAKRTLRTKNAEKSADIVDRGLCRQALDACAACCSSILQRIIPFYNSSRLTVKQFVEHLIRGDDGFALRVRFSGINFLVLCSLIFLFVDVVTLAFLSERWDHPLAVLGLFVWIVLMVELVCEFIIRPYNYFSLIKSDKAFSPSTARHINRFHLICEVAALLMFLPQTIHVLSGKENGIPFFSRETVALWAINGSTSAYSVLGRLSIGLTFLRTFGLVRHWKQMWINHTFEEKNQESYFFRKLLLVNEQKRAMRRRIRFRRNRQSDDETDFTTSRDDMETLKKIEKPQDTSSPEDQQLKHAAQIGTALMVVNSHRALFLLTIIVCVFPMLISSVVRNDMAENQVHLLQANNVISNSSDDCNYLRNSVHAWITGFSYADMRHSWTSEPYNEFYLVFAQLLPKRCEWQRDDGVISFCNPGEIPPGADEICDFWSYTIPVDGKASSQYFADMLGIRVKSLVDIVSIESAPSSWNDTSGAEFYVRAIFNESRTVSITYFSLFLLMAGMVLLSLLGLTVMRSDAKRLVLDPLQRMLMIVIRYAENPLSTTANSKEHSRRDGDINRLSYTEDAKKQLGTYETEQLINAITKIADLLRKCWGVAGAGIISSNLARTKDGKTVVFNPTIPGKQVYALFGFVGINDFSKQLRVLEKDVMILINDVAKVVHDEVYRWSFGDSGQCNKNLGSTFLMVFRIGDFTEVHDKKKRATDVVFNSEMKNVKLRQRQGTARRRSSSRHFDLSGNGNTLQLASLPGIQAFTDRALLGCLKSYAGLHRDQELQKWRKDFRLSAGVGNFTLDVIYGMDAGWAVEGAVGSEYKIDATYLSPHVNMASRMMSATKQYGVKVLLSQAVEELLSKQARSKLRHLDTVYVKGSNVEQRIYTYDARHEGVDFFLFERSPDQADIEAEAYTPAVWDTDQDLRAMRQHVSDEFMHVFHKGVEQYLEGNWKSALGTLQKADDLMFEAVLEQGYVDYVSEDLGEYGKNTKLAKEELNRLKDEFGDGASKCLIHFMLKRGGVPPTDWHGVRHLMSK